MSEETKAAATTDLEKDSRFMDQYSRQIGAFGMETMAKLIKLKVLIKGLRGIGVETAKNLILAGPGEVALVDPEVAQIQDLGANFFLTEEDVASKHSRAHACAPKLQELNRMVRVHAEEGDVTEEMVAKYDVMVCTEGSLNELERWNTFCHEKGVKFIATRMLGPMGYVFVDFGEHFAIRDGDGENPAVRVITDISTGPDGEITLDREGRMHGLDVDNDHTGWVTISGVEGMEGKDGGPSINEAGPFRVRAAFKTVYEEGKDGERKAKKVFDPYRLVIGDTTKFTEYLRGGVMTQVKVPFSRKFRAMKESLQQPIPDGEAMLMFSDGAKWQRAEQLHIALRALGRFEAAHGHLPAVGDKAAAEEVVKLAKELNEEASKLNEGATSMPPPALSLESVDEAVVRLVALYASAELQPMATVFGGVVAQEVVKLTGKFTPLNQWLHLDFLEVVPEEPVADGAPEGGRYDHIISVFGKALQQRLASARTFMVGCGALGCEFLKNFALLGVGCGAGGLVTVTDNDRIEVSNLNRQFLFREHNVGQPKSVAASEAVRAMNAAIQVRTLETLVCPDTETTFDDAFWEGQDFVTNALDNIKARLYVDSRCVFYGKPLLESGTLGTKCNVQVVLPHKTESYGDHKDAEDEDNIPMCTLRNFPSLIDHCIEWSRAQFTDLFVTPFADASKFVADKAAYLAALRRETVDAPNPSARASNVAKALPGLRSLRRCLETVHAMRAEAADARFLRCVAQAHDLFLRFFRDRILDLTHEFPRDAKHPKTGEPFWSGSKRFPEPLEFDPREEQHVNFVISTANLLAVGYGVQPAPGGPETFVPAGSAWRKPSFVGGEAASLPVRAWAPSAGKIAVDEEDEAAAEAKEADDAEQREFAELLAFLEGADVSGVVFEPADFEKDQDANFHIDFVAAASNLRASNYKIQQASRHKCKMIAGKIIPAIATTTATVTGMVMLEMIKLLRELPMESFRNSSNNLGINQYQFFEPIPPAKAQDEYDEVLMEEVKCKPAGFTKWDKTLVDGGRRLTVDEFIAKFKEVTGLNCVNLLHPAANTHPAAKGKPIYNKNEARAALRAEQEANRARDLLEVVHELYEVPTGLQIITPTRTYIELDVECEDEEGDSYKVPTVVYKFASAPEGK
eukprot:CAMPEP_0196769604 /NCGR_PEP_ID=MMETSP1104-20130614/633_1 /TAXON_ID=33652 /ORGANISM="Cafeteria sp., Strain Caron Lab Isolate" /LENGTH=1139 /DNA_ID=CAMNT_0042139701 /DNA_START=23 /DNA_END=3442 /DNA_ORIENTATION=+